MNDTLKNVPAATSPRSSTRAVIGLVVLVVGLIHVFLPMVGGGRYGLGALFFRDKAVEVSLADAVEATKPFADVCKNPESEKAFDQSSAKGYHAWCEAVSAVQTEPTPEAGVALLKLHNRNFNKIVERMLNKGGTQGELATVLMESACMVRPPLEDVFSETSGAAFSQALIGLILTAIGIWNYRKGRRGNAPAAAPSDDSAPVQA